jgi:hypothetical protein
MTMRARLHLGRVLLVLLSMAVIGSVAYPIFYSTVHSAATGEISKAVNIEPPMTRKEEIDIFKWLVGGLFCILGFFFINTIRKIDRNQDKLFEMHGGLRHDFDTLKGTHDGIFAEHGRRHGD